MADDFELKDNSECSLHVVSSGMQCIQSWLWAKNWWLLWKNEYIAAYVCKCLYSIVITSDRNMCSLWLYSNQ